MMKDMIYEIETQVDEMIRKINQNAFDSGRHYQTGAGFM